MDCTAKGTSYTGSAMTLTEAKTVMLMRVAFKVEDDQMAKLATLLWGKKRVTELAGYQDDKDDIGEDLVMAAEETLKFPHGAFARLELEECSCTKCGNTEYFLTEPFDYGKRCPKCNTKDSVFLPKVETFDMHPEPGEL